MQKFKKYDLVRIADDLGPCMSHFTSGCDAIIIASYFDEYGGEDSDHHYTLYLPLVNGVGGGTSAWYYEEQLTLISHDRKDLFYEWKAAEAENRRIKSDIDLIFENGPEILKNITSTSIEALGGMLGISKDRLWGKNGEGITYYENLAHILDIATPFLLNRDRGGWNSLCEKFKAGLDPCTGMDQGEKS